MSELSIHTDHVDDEGIIDDAPHNIETYYRPMFGIGRGGTEPDRYLRVFIDDDPCNMETRIPYAELVRIGWTPPMEITS